MRRKMFVDCDGVKHMDIYFLCLHPLHFGNNYPKLHSNCYQSRHVCETNFTSPYVFSIVYISPQN